MNAPALDGRLPLSHLQAQFLRATAHGGWAAHPTLDDADGVVFLCPRCYVDNGGPEGAHLIICWFEGRVGDDLKPGPGRWKPQGSSLADLSFVPTKRTSSTSVKLLGGCNFHGHVIRGHIALR